MNEAFTMVALWCVEFLIVGFPEMGAAIKLFQYCVT